MIKFLTDILIDPLKGSELFFNADKNIFFTENEEISYLINENVPVLLPSKMENKGTDLHKNFTTDFDYAGHYQKDAEVHNYFEPNLTAIAKNELHRLHQAIVNAVPADANLIADVGCGNGWVAAHFLQHNKQVISIDISTVNPVKVLKAYPHKYHAALVADVFHLPIKNNSLDCIIAAEIMEHVYDPKLFIDRLIEKLKPGGKLVISTPYKEKIEYYICVHCNLPTPKNAHLHSFDKQNIGSFINNENIASWTAKPFASKFLIKSRLNLLLSFLSFKLWKMKDSFANMIFHSPTRFLIKITKK